jgi:hypothetical protein
MKDVAQEKKLTVSRCDWTRSVRPGGTTVETAFSQHKTNISRLALTKEAERLRKVIHAVGIVGGGGGTALTPPRSAVYTEATAIALDAATVVVG